MAAYPKAVPPPGRPPPPAASSSSPRPAATTPPVHRRRVAARLMLAAAAGCSGRTAGHGACSFGVHTSSGSPPPWHTAQDTEHLPRINAELGVPYQAMLFFDDEHKNVKKVGPGVR